jgi:hypothetical protein
MPNHYHLLLQLLEEIRIPYLQRLNSTYAKIFNDRTGRPGHVMDPRAWWRDRDGWVLPAHVAAYQALNPERPGMVSHPENYPYSSYAATIGLRPKPRWLEDDYVLRPFAGDPAGARGAFRKYVEARIPEWRSAIAMAGRISGVCSNVHRVDRLRDRIESLAYTISCLRSSGRLDRLPFSESELLVHAIGKFADVPRWAISAILQMPHSTVSRRLGRLRERLSTDHELQSRLDQSVDLALAS